MKNVLRKYIQLKLSILKPKKLTKMKKYILLLTFVQLFFIKDIFPGCGNNEICVYNNTEHSIQVYIYPVSMIMNGFNMYNPIGKWRVQSDPYTLYDYLNGVTIDNISFDKKIYTVLPPHSVAPNDFTGYVYDAFEKYGISCRGLLGYGIYKIQVTHLVENPYDDSCLYEIDYFEHDEPPYEPFGDLFINVYDGSMKYRFFGFGYGEVTMNYDSPENYTILLRNPGGPQSDPYREKRFGPSTNSGLSFYTLKTEYSPYENETYNNKRFPFDGRKDCDVIQHSGWTDQNNWTSQTNNSRFFEDIRQGNLTFNLEIKKDVSTRNVFFGSDLYEKNLPVNVLNGSVLKLCPENTSITMTLKKNGSLSFYPNFYMNIKTGGKLILDGSNTIEIKEGATVNLEDDSYITITQNSDSKIRIYPGGVFCNYGANITGILRIQFIRTPHEMPCGQYSSNYTIDDSTQITLKDTASLEIPDNTTVYFRNPESSLYLDSNSTLLMGTNSKLVFEDGAKLFAYKTKFKCSDSTATWDGIYLCDFSNDTIKNCIIENADNGINIQDRYTVATQPEPSTEISNCTFRNITNSNLTNGIYVSNSNNVLIRNNTFEAPNQNAGFSTGILVEYCPSGNINIIDNNIDYAETGISVIQSSPYIYKNTITGRDNARIGIFLDNSNCNIKNNTIENFQNSISLYYSSPYLFQNELNNASGSNLYLQSNSTPLLGPVTSQSTSNWLGGNNRIAGYPNTAGIEFNNDSYPEMIDGFNIDSVNGSNYLTGTIPDALNGALIVTNNNWDDSIPVSNKFAVSNGSVMYNPTYNGVTPIDYDNYDLYNIGFGLYDTVLTKDLSMMSPGGNVLFMQAYKREKQKDYISAVLLYKQVINNFKNSFYAAASIERIFNCLEKSQFNFILYYSYQSYLIQIKNNDKYPRILRELAEDYIIKCKIKRRLFIEAIADYQNMFEENLNKPKGLHAFLNKECVLAMLIDTSRNLMVSQYSQLNLHKQNLLAIINQQRLTISGMKTGNESPKSFKLEQNYPNPFNPVTNIKYGLPKDIFVTIKIYDILGREIKTLVNDFQRTGEYVISFNGNNIASGVYFYQLKAGDFISVKRMVLIK